MSKFLWYKENVSFDVGTSNHRIHLIDVVKFLISALRLLASTLPITPDRFKIHQVETL